MMYGTPEGKRGMSYGGVDYDLRSIYAGLGELTDIRKARIMQKPQPTENRAKRVVIIMDQEP